MTIVKKDALSNNIERVNYDFLPVEESTNTKMIKQFDKEDFMEAIKDATQNGFESGFEKGKEDGFKKGLEESLEIKNNLLVEIENLNEELKTLELTFQENIESLANKYIYSNKDTILQILKGSIDKVFSNCLENEMLMTVYLNELISKTVTNNSTTLILNEFTLNNLDNTHNVKTIVDNSLNNWDFVVQTKSEFEEFFLNERFTAIKALFEK